MLRIYMPSTRQNSKSSLSLHPSSSPTSSHTDQNVSNTRHGDLFHPLYVTTSSYTHSLSLLLLSSRLQEPSPSSTEPMPTYLPYLSIYLTAPSPFSSLYKNIQALKSSIHPELAPIPYLYKQAGATPRDQNQSSFLERLEPHSLSLSLYKYIILSYMRKCFKYDVLWMQCKSE